MSFSFCHVLDVYFQEFQGARDKADYVELVNQRMNLIESLNKDFREPEHSQILQEERTYCMQDTGKDDCQLKEISINNLKKLIDDLETAITSIIRKQNG